MREVVMRGFGEGGGSEGCGEGEVIVRGSLREVVVRGFVS